MWLVYIYYSVSILRVFEHSRCLLSFYVRRKTERHKCLLMDKLENIHFLIDFQFSQSLNKNKFRLSFHRELLLYIFNACTNCKKIVKCNSGWELVNSPSFIKPCHLSDFTWFLTVKKNAKYFEIKPDVQCFITEFTQELLINRVMAIRFPQLS